jgi:hypothetical protein
MATRQGFLDDLLIIGSKLPWRVRFSRRSSPSPVFISLTSRRRHPPREPLLAIWAGSRNAASFT